MPIINPIRLDRLQQGIFESLGSAVAPATVEWAYGQAAFEQLGTDLVSLTMSAGPTQWSRKGKRGSLLLPFDTITVKVLAATEAVRDIVRVNEIDFFFDVPAASSTEDVRDALVTALGADVANNPWTVAAGVPVDELILTPNFLGSVFAMRLLGELSSPSQTTSGNAVLVTKGTRLFTITIESFSKNREPRDGAWNLMAQVLSAFEAEDLIGILSSFGVAVWDKGAATDISAIAGANWESRVTVDVQMTAQSVFVRPVDQIETVNVDLTVLGDEGTIIATETATVSN